MNTIHRAQRGILGKLAYRLFLRKMLKHAVLSTETKFDDKMLKMLDSYSGYK